MTAVGQAFSGGQNALTRIASTLTVMNVVKSADKFDAEYLNVKHWKTNQFGLLTNTWIKFYLDINKLKEYVKEIKASKDLSTIKKGSDILKAGNSIKLANTISFFLDKVIDEFEFDLEAGKYIAVTLDNISINVSRTPTIIEHNVIGLNNSVKQFFSSNSYDITITGLLAGAVTWQQDSETIKTLLAILGAGFPVKVSNPELDIMYEVNSIVPFSFTFDQDPRGYHLKAFTLSCKSDDDDNLIINIS